MFLILAGSQGGGREPALREPASYARFEFAQLRMGTRFRIVLYAPDAPTAASAGHAAFDRIAKLDDIMSDYRPTSELMLLCQRAGGPPVKVSEDLFRVLAKSQEIAERSNGAFDVTVSPVVRLWRQARLRRELPSPQDLAQALRLLDYRNLRLDVKRHTAQLLKPGMLLDLGGIAKGDAADQAIALLKQRGIRRALVAAGGDIAVSGPPPGRTGWLIAIAPLDQPGRTPTRYFLLHNGAVSTSGDTEQHMDVGGVRYSHIIDPKTGMGLTGHSSVTVVAPDGITSDSLATAVSVLGAKQGVELIKSMPDAGVLFLQASKDGVGSFEWNFPAPMKAESRRQ